MSSDALDATFIIFQYDKYLSVIRRIPACQNIYSQGAPTFLSANPSGVMKLASLEIRSYCITLQDENKTFEVFGDYAVIPAKAGI